MRTLDHEFPSVDPTKVALFLDIQWTYREMQSQYDAILADHQLSESKFIILMFLRQAPNQQLTPSEIASKLGATKATVTKLLNRMNEKGLIEKLHSSSDKRSLNIKLTAMGQSKLSEFLPFNFGSVDTLMEDLSADEVNQFSMLLDKIKTGTKKLSDKRGK
ncbi:MarR family winged helix-turn-helix transcriptional regulator [Pediococcus claussenii]|nr:MarR family transcriptional regulator [Pediococcus claussenii]